MVDVAVIKARAATRLAAASPHTAKLANPANWLTPTATISQLATLASNDEPHPDPDRWCWPHSDAMNGAELDRMTLRLRMFKRHGIADSEADRMADKLMKLERQGSALRACLACDRLTGGASDGWRCSVGRPARVDRLHRCDAFAGPGAI